MLYKKHLNMPNFLSISEKIAKLPQVRERVYDDVQEKVDIAQENVIDAFDNHEITQELENGENSSNLSDTLGGYGNLFSFIGFEAGEDPIGPIRRILETYIKLYKTPTDVRNYHNGQIKFTFRLRYPTLVDFEEDTPYPDGWMEGSWLYGIEHGIYGFQSYLYDPEFEKYTQSRSTTALQAKRDGIMIPIRGGKFQNTKYMTQLLKDFLSEVKND